MPRRLARSLASASLHLRLTALIALVIALLVGGFAAYVAHRQAQVTGDLLLVRARTLAANVAALAQNEVATNDGIALARRLEGFNEFADLRAAAVTDRQGRPLAAARRNVAENLQAVAPHETGGLGTPGQSRLPRAGLWMDDEPLVLWTAIGPIAPIGWVRMEYDAKAVLAARNRILSEALVFGLAALLFAIVAVRAILRGPVAAIRAATEFSRRMAAGGSAQMGPPSHARELRELIDALNCTSVRLQEEHAALKRTQQTLRDAGTCAASAPPEGGNAAQGLAGR